MKKQSKLLKVFSIILIVFGALSLLSSIFSFAMKDAMEQAMETMAATGIAMPTTFDYLLALIGSLIMLAAGIIGVAYKSRQMVLIIGIALAVYYIFNIVYTFVTAGFSILSLISLIWPLLYLWGWYQSN